jgi:hypothetical protein
VTQKLFIIKIIIINVMIGSSLDVDAASLDTTPSLSPSPTPSLGDPAFILNAIGGVSVVALDPILPSPTSSPTPSLCTACTRCVILLPSQSSSRGSKSGSRLDRACKAGRLAASHQLATWRRDTCGGTAPADRSTSRLPPTCSHQCELPLQCEL